MTIVVIFPCRSGWRPSFRYYSQWVALLGSGVCLIIMFVISWWAALITLIAVGTLYKIVDWTKPGKGGGQTMGQVLSNTNKPRLWSCDG